MSSDVLNRVLSTNRADKQAARMLLVVLADAAYRNGLVVRTRKHLLDRACITEDTFDTAMHGLIERGAVVRIPRFKSSGKQQCNAYWLPLYTTVEHVESHLEAEGECWMEMADWVDAHPGCCGKGGNALPPPTSGGARNSGGQDRSPLYGLYDGNDVDVDGKDVKAFKREAYPHGDGEAQRMAADAASFPGKKNPSDTPTAPAHQPQQSATAAVLEEAPPTARELARTKLFNTIAADTGGEWGRILRPDGKPYAHLGRVWGVLGKRLADDPVRALVLWNEFAREKREKYSWALRAQGVVAELTLWLNGKQGQDALFRVRQTR